MAIDYVQWVNQALDRKPHLSQAGLARHLNRHRSIVTMMLRGKRQIKAAELDKIAAYIGEPVPGREGAASAVGAVPVIGRCGSAWYERGEAPTFAVHVAPVLREPYATQRQVAYVIEAAAAGLPAGSTVIAIPASSAKGVPAGAVVVVERERAGLVNLTLARIGEAPLPGHVVALGIEARIPL